MASKKRRASQQSSPMPGGWRWAALVLIVFVLLTTIILMNSDEGLKWIGSYREFPEKIRELGIFGQLAIIGLMIVHSFVPFPAEFVAIAAGNVYGTLHGTFLTWLGAMLGANLSFGLTRLFGQPFVNWALPVNQQKMLDKWTEDQGAATLLVSRFIPLIAFNLINYAAGLTKISWWTFIWTTGLGILPLTALFVHMGVQMQELSWPKLLLVSALCIAAMGAWHFYNRKYRKKLK